MTRRLLAATAVLLVGLSAARADFITDPVGDFLPTFSGSKTPDLDVVSAGGTFDGQVFRLFATMNGAIGTNPNNVYVWGINTGAGTEQFNTGPVPTGQGIFFNRVVTLRFNPTTSAITTTAGTTGFVSGNSVELDVPLSLLPSTGFAPQNYTWNLWPRDSSSPAGNPASNNRQISDFAPDASNAAFAPSPAPGSAVLLGLGGLTLAGWRRWRKG